MHARSAGPAGILGRYVDRRFGWLIRDSPALTPEQPDSSSIVDHGDGCIPAKSRVLHGSRHASSRASPRIPCV